MLSLDISALESQRERESCGDTGPSFVSRASPVTPRVLQPSGDSISLNNSDDRFCFRCDAKLRFNTSIKLPFDPIGMVKVSFLSATGHFICKYLGILRDIYVFPTCRI